MRTFLLLLFRKKCPFNNLSLMFSRWTVSMKQLNPSTISIYSTTTTACCLVLYSPWAENVFYIFKWLKKINRRKISHDTWKLYEIPMSSSKIYWNTAMHRHLDIVYGCFRTTTAELSSFNRDYISCKAKYLLFGPLEKKFADP